MRDLSHKIRGFDKRAAEKKKNSGKTGLIRILCSHFHKWDPTPKAAIDCALRIPLGIIVVQTLPMAASVIEAERREKLFVFEKVSSRKGWRILSFPRTVLWSSFSLD